MQRFFRNFRQALTKQRLMILGAILLLAALQWFTWVKRYPLIAQKQAEIAEILALEQEVERLRQEWNSKQEERKKADADLATAYGRLFEGDPAASTWSSQIDRPPETLTFTVRPEKSIAHPEYPDQLVILPTSWSVKNPAENPNTLDALIEFLHDLTTRQAKWIDLVGLQINGNETTQTRAEFSLRLWFKKEATS